MPSRLHAVLVFFSLRDDHRLEAELNAAPLTFWRLAAVASALGLALALAVLWLAGHRLKRSSTGSVQRLDEHRDVPSAQTMKYQAGAPSVVLVEMPRHLDPLHGQAAVVAGR